MKMAIGQTETSLTTSNKMQKGKIFTCMGKTHGAPCLPVTREEWEEMRREPFLADLCRQIERGDEQLKHRLPVWTPHCAEFRGNHRAIADALKPLNRLMLDFDEKGHTDDILSRLSAKGEELRMRGIEVLLVEESVRRGTHVLVELPTGVNAEEAQQLMQEVTGFEPDKAVKDVARCIYMVPEGHTRYLNDKIFETNPTPLLSPEGEDRKTPNNLEVSPRGDLEGGNPSPRGGQEGVALCFRGIPYSSIISEYWNRTGGTPVEGERNVRLHQLAVNLRSICDNKKEVLMQIMPRLGLSETELQSIVESACKEPPKGVSKTISSIIQDSRFKIQNEEYEDEDSTPLTSREGKGMGPSKLKLPIGLKESLIGVPETMHMPVLCAVLPLAAAYADGVEVEYCDGHRQHLGLMSIVRGEQASGKSVCKDVIDVWKRQFDEEDRMARKREDEWKEVKKSRKANEKAPEDPQVLIRMLPVTVSCSTLLKRLKYANGHCLYSFGEELDTLRKTNGAGSWSAKYDIYRLGFDRGEWGQDYNSDQAESGVVRVAYNWTVLGTNGAMRKCFRQDNIENGLSSRILVSEMPDASFAKMPHYKKRSKDEEARIQEAVTKLRSCSGFIDTPRLRKVIDKWVEAKRIEAAKDIDHVKDTYRRRAAVIGFRCGVVFHLLTGCNKESKACLEFALMMAQYTLEQQINAFGKALSQEFVSAKDECSRYGVNNSVFDQLQPTFTMDDLRALKNNTCGESALRNIITRWRRDGWIEKTDTKHWCKLSNSSNS